MNISSGKIWMIKKFKDSGLVLLDQAILSGTNFLTGILLARFLGLEVYGLFALLWMIVLFGLSFSQAFITKPMLSLGPSIETENRKDYYAGLYIIRLIFSGLSFIVSTVGLALFYHLANIEFSSIGFIFKIPLILGGYLLYDFYRKYFFVKEDLKSPILFDGVLSFLQLSGILILQYLGFLSLENVLSILVGTYIVLNLFVSIKMISPSFDKLNIVKVFKQNIFFAKWLIGTALLQWLCGNFFIIAGGAILGTAAVGAVRIAQNIVGLTHVFFLAMENIVPVYAAKHFKDGGIKSLFVYLKKLSFQSGSLIFTILISLSIFSPVIIELLYGEEFVPFSFVLVGFCIMYFLVFIGHPLRFALRTLEYTKPIFIGYILGAVFSFLFAYPLLHNFEMIGLLTGMFVTQLIAQMVYVFAILKIKKSYENNPLSSR